MNVDIRKSFCRLNRLEFTVHMMIFCKADTKWVLLEAGKDKYLTYALLRQSPCSLKVSTSLVAIKAVVAPPLLKLDHPY